MPVVALHGPDAAALQRDAARIAVEHLLDLGHASIGHLAGPPDWVEARARAEGFDAELAARGLGSAGTWRGDWSAASGFAATDGVARSIREGGPTAMFVANDQMALGLISGLVGAGLSVPGDLSVVGVDDNPDAAFYRPALTTVRLDVAGEAARCIADVLGLPAPAAPGAPVLVARASSAAR